MKNAKRNQYAVRKNPTLRTWDVVRVVDFMVMTGGFPSRAIAVAEALEWERRHNPEFRKVFGARYIVKRTSPQSARDRWCVVRVSDQVIVEGGFFGRVAAEHAAAQWETEAGVR